MTTNGLHPNENKVHVPVWRRGLVNVAAALRLVTRLPRIKSHEPWIASFHKLSIAVTIFIAAFVFAMTFLDARIIEFALRLPRWVIALFDVITDFGKSGWFLWPLGILFLTLAAMPQTLNRFSQLVLAALMVRVGFLFLAIGVPGLFVTTVKRMIGRARPLVTGHVDPFAFAPFIWRAAYASFPSGHATTAFSVLVAFGTLWPQSRVLLLIYAVLIAMSRVVITAHYPTDVLTGAIVGTVGALMVRRWFAMRQLGFSLELGGGLRQFPGPSLKRIKSVARDLLAE